MSNLPVLYDQDFAFWQRCAQYAPGTWVAAHVIEPELLVDGRWESHLDRLYRERSMWFDRQANPITVERWGILRELGLDAGGSYGENSYVRIGRDTVGDAEVSTVWLGMDHGFNFDRDEDYRPVIFETMIFGGKYSDYQMRYCTEAEAEKGHREAVTDLRAGMQPWWAYGGQYDDEWHMRGIDE